MQLLWQQYFWSLSRVVYLLAQLESFTVSIFLFSSYSGSSMEVSLKFDSLLLAAEILGL
jgi:hypothetical protein